MRHVMIAAAAILLPGAAQAQLAGSDQAIHVEAMKSEFLPRECRGFYDGDVVATQGEARLTSDRLTMIGSAAPGGGQLGDCETEQLIAEGRVRYSAPRLKIGADRGEYDTIGGTITFTGDVIMASGERGVVRGTKLVYNVADESSRITAGDEPVRMIITPAQNGVATSRDH